LYTVKKTGLKAIGRLTQRRKRDETEETQVG
jgi:hypothetical protein